MTSPAKPAAARFLVFLVAFTALGGGLATLGLFGFLEILVHVPIPSELYMAVGVVEALFMVGLMAVRAPRYTIVGIGVVILNLMALYLVPWCSLKSFLRDLDRVRPGMTYPEVEAIMGRYMKGAGAKWYIGTEPPPPPPPDAQPDGTIIYRHSNDWQHDSDWGMVTFDKGRVVEVEFSSD